MQYFVSSAITDINKHLGLQYAFTIPLLLFLTNALYQYSGHTLPNIGANMICSSIFSFIQSKVTVQTK